MTHPRSPFLVYENFLSPLLCEQIIDGLNYFTPDIDREGKPLMMQKHHEVFEDIAFKRLKQIVASVQEYYGFTYNGTERMYFEWYPQSTVSQPKCENSNYIRKKWVRTKNRDISGVIFLVDYQETIPFDTKFEVFGGKLEFPQHNFGFNPTRGTLILFPSGPHFINCVSPIFAGDLYMIRFHIAAQLPYLYNPEKFLGKFTDWFQGKY
ncbi:MAG: hypothetical protein ACREAU_05560 [Nitrosopumilaceae archaeon]